MLQAQIQLGGDLFSYSALCKGEDSNNEGTSKEFFVFTLLPHCGSNGKVLHEPHEQ